MAQGSGDVARRVKGTGAAVNLVMPRYSNDKPCGSMRAGTMATCMQAPTTARSIPGRRAEVRYSGNLYSNV